MPTTNDLAEQFLVNGRGILEDPSTPAHSLTIAPDRWSLRLEFPAQSPDGFEVYVTVDEEGIVVGAGSLLHIPFDDHETPAGNIEGAFACIRDLLSPSWRLREIWAGRMPYRAHVETLADGHWVITYTVSLMIWNFFGERSERIFVNRQMPPR